MKTGRASPVSLHDGRARVATRLISILKHFDMSKVSRYMDVADVIEVRKIQIQLGSIKDKYL